MKRVNVLILVLVLAFVMSGCSIINNSGSNADDGDILATNMVRYNSHGGTDFGFNVNFITSNKDANVEFVKFTGEHIQGLTVKLADDTYDTIKDLKYEGKYIRILGFVCKTADEYVKINSVTLKIDGTEREFPFETPIEHYVETDEDNADVQSGNFAAIISTNSYDSTEYPFGYFIESDVVITDFGFNEFLDVSSAAISIDGEEKGNLKDLLPLSLSKGSGITIRCFLKLRNSKATKYDSIYCDSQLSYSSGGKDMIYSEKLVSQSVSNENDAKDVIDLLTKSNQ